MPNLDTYKTDVEVILIDKEDNDHDNHSGNDDAGSNTNDSIVDNESNEHLAPTAETTTAASKKFFDGANDKAKKQSFLLVASNSL